MWLRFFRLSTADCWWLAYWIAISIEIFRSWDSRQRGAISFLLQSFLIALVLTRVISNWVRIAYSAFRPGIDPVVGGRFLNEHAGNQRVDTFAGLTLFTRFFFQGVLVSLLVFPFAIYPPEFSWWFLALLYSTCCQVDGLKGSWLRYLQYAGYTLLFVLGVMAAFSDNISLVGREDVVTKSIALSTSDMAHDYPFVGELVDPPLIQASLGLLSAIVATISLMQTQVCRLVKWKVLGVFCWGVAVAGAVGFYYWNKTVGILSLGPFMTEGLGRFDWELRGLYFSESFFTEWIVGPKEVLVLGLLVATVFANALHAKDSIELNLKSTAKRRLADFDFVVWLLLTVWMVWYWGAYFFSGRRTAVPFFYYWPTILMPLVMWQLAWRQLPGWKMVFLPWQPWRSKAQAIRLTVFHPIFYPLTILMLLISFPPIGYCVQWFLIYLYFCIFRGG